ncbi:MAG: hypothetical protein IKW97_09125 [Muribaculaceae bacterium]|nr:hypothetical protein [Muribaculaceae bacterium]
MAQNICPKCGSTNIGTSAAHKFKKGATYAADAALGLIGGYYGGDLAVEVLSKTGGISDNVSFTKEYQCRDCGYIWKGEDAGRIPDHVIQQQKDRLEAMNKTNARSCLKWGIIYGLVTAVCAFYCLVYDLTTTTMEDTLLFGNTQVAHVDWLWLLLFIVGICTAFCTYSKLKDYNLHDKSAKELNQMSISEFRTSRYMVKL